MERDPEHDPDLTLDATEDEFTGRGLGDYEEPAAEPLCWTHNSNVCGCEDDRVLADIGPETGEPHRYSTEPPFPPDWRPPSDDLDVWPLR
ncbi:hypothetical protein AB0K93_07640 [Streptomyces sp. NPDC052676]|uniref:hypothetical protein n=1 Tax=Streptomyces sp. NPDC052676 TaxID=3154953 RepID=UPI00344380D5